jgi:hypothetical protein
VQPISPKSAAARRNFGGCGFQVRPAALNVAGRTGAIVRPGQCGVFQGNKTGAITAGPDICTPRQNSSAGRTVSNNLGCQVEIHRPVCGKLRIAPVMSGGLQGKRQCE